MDITAGSWELLTAVVGLVVCHPGLAIGHNRFKGVFAGDDCFLRGFEVPA